VPLRDSLADGSFSSGSSSDSGFSTDDSVPDPGDEDDNRPPRERQPLPEGVDLSQARLGRGIKGGAFGTVSRVDGAQGAPPLVVKVPKGNNRAELEHEAEYYAKIGPHPSIAICLGMQKIGRQEGLVMEGIKGADMHKAMNRLELLSKADPRTAKENGMDRALSHEEYMGTMQYMLRETLKGLEQLEKAGVVHADIRPDNIMCDSETGAVKIVDFGLAFESDLPQQQRIVPMGHGMVAPEQVTQGTTVTSKSDVFATGEIARKSLEGDQFRYNKDDRSSTPGVRDAQEFGEKGFDGKDKQSLNRMSAPDEPPTNDDGGTADPGERMSDLRSRVARLLQDPILKKNQTVTGLGFEIQQASRNLSNLDEAEIDELEARMAVAERSFKTSGTYGAITSYTQFVNWAMHPDPSKRPSATEALNHPFLQDALLDDDKARAVLKKMVAPPPGGQTIPLDPGSDSDSWSSTSTSSDWSSDSTSGDFGGSATEGQPDENGFITKTDDSGYTVWLTEAGTWSRDQRDAKKHSPESGEGKPDKNGFITKKDDSGYMVWLTEAGTWSRDMRTAKKHPSGGGRQPQPSVGQSVPEDDSISDDSNDSLRGSVTDDKPESDAPVSKKDESGYTVWLTEQGTWSRNRHDAKKPSPNGGSPSGTEAREEHDGSGRQYEDLNGGDSYTNALERNPETNDKPEEPEAKEDDGKGGGWTRGAPSPETKRGGPTLGRGRSGAQPPKPEAPKTKEEDGKGGGWSRGAPSPDTKRGGPTLGRGRR